MLAGLADLAWSMQTRRIAEAGAEGSDAGVLTVVARVEAVEVLGGETLIKWAEDATILEGQAEIRFRHQLLQEYFTSLSLKQRFEQGSLSPAQLWPAEHWWKRSGWEEAVVLLAGLFPEDCAPVIRWLADAQPEVAAQCVLESGAEIADQNALFAELRAAWLPRLADTEREPKPQARAAVGRALGHLNLDNRKGVGLDARESPTSTGSKCRPAISCIRTTSGATSKLSGSVATRSPTPSSMPSFKIVATKTTAGGTV